jgi:hypothetical protein
LSSRDEVTAGSVTVWARGSAVYYRTRIATTFCIKRLARPAKAGRENKIRER